MFAQILQINFKFTVSATEYRTAVAPLTQPVADVAGLRWKIWLLNDEQHEAGGIYLFEDASYVQSFLAGPLMAAVKATPIFQDITVKVFDVIEEFTEATRGPVWTEMTV